MGKAFTVSVLVIFLILAGCGNPGNSAVETARSSETDSSGISLPAGIPALLDLGSTSCVPCRMMTEELETLDSLTGESLFVLVIDVNQNERAAQHYRIRLIPTQIFLSENGEELFRHEGFFSFDDMMSKWRELGYSFDQGQ